MAYTPTRDELIAVIWDALKEVYGVRPRWVDFSGMSYDELNTYAIEASESAASVVREERAVYARAICEFRASIRAMIKCGANNHQTAIRWLIGGVGEHVHDSDAVCYHLGLPHSFAKYFNFYFDQRGK